MKNLDRLDERKRRKDFILERNLLCPNPFEKYLSPEELQICEKYKVFTRFHSKEEHEELLKTIIKEHRLAKRIQDLKVLHSTMHSAAVNVLYLHIL
jgi:transcriptional adapter 2-alpha